MLDLTHILLADHDVAAFATKRQAKQLATSRGWNACDIMRAFNRFNVFWVVGERLDTSLRLATKAPGWVHVTYRQATA